MTPPRPLAARLRLDLLALATLSLLCVACGSHYKVIKASGPPSALRGAVEVKVAFDYTDFVVEGRSEENWVTEKTAKDPEYGKTWTDLKARFETKFLDGFTSVWPTSARLAEGETPAEGTTVAVVKVRELDIGRLIPFATRNSKIDVRVRYTRKEDPDAEIAIKGEDTPSLTNPSIFQHVGRIGHYLGRVSAIFVEDQQK